MRRRSRARKSQPAPGRAPSDRVADSRSMRLFSALAAMLATLALAAAASASPVASSDATYAALGRVFPDPQSAVACVAPLCSPFRQGNVPAASAVGFGEFQDALRYMNTKAEWKRFMEVWPLSDGTFDGNDLGRLEFKPDPSFISAGLPSALSRVSSPLYVVRVTDESVPDAGKERYVVSLSIHGAERQGAEGGTRAMEDLVTAVTTGRLMQPVVTTKEIGVPVPTFGDVLRRAIVYFAWPNPDGWRRGDAQDAHALYQRFNGNGVDLNRDWPVIGGQFSPYSALSEPETKAFHSFLSDLGGHGPVRALDDLHGQLVADSFSYMLLIGGRRDFQRNEELRLLSLTINKVQREMLGWSPLIDESLTSAPDCTGGVVCPTGMAAQTFGTVYDTLNYTAAGSLVEWAASPGGLDAVGVGNEMSFSSQSAAQWDPHVTQLWIDGNRGIIYAHLAELLARRRAKFAARGRKAYVALPRVKRRERGARAPSGDPQPAIDATATGTPDRIEHAFEVAADRENGGMRVDVTALNAQGIAPGRLTNHLLVQCRACDPHIHAGEPDGEWITVAEDFTQSNVFLQGGLTAAVNTPQARAADGRAVQWRAIIENPLTPAVGVRIVFTRGPATTSHTTGGAEPPRLAGYSVAATDFWRDLNRFAPKRERLRRLDARRITRGRRVRLPRADTLVLTDDHAPRLRRSSRAYRRWLTALRRFTRRGGNLVLTDGALRALPELFPAIPAAAVKRREMYQGQIGFVNQASASKDPAQPANTLADPLSRDVAQTGARFQTGLRRQVYEGVPLGYPINDSSVAISTAPQWTVERAAFEAAGGRIAGIGATTTISAAADDSVVVLGELALGRGVVRIVGALLPQPSAKFPHPEGVEPHALTYTGYLVARNLVDYARPR